MYAGGPVPTSGTPGTAVTGKAGIAVRDEVAIAGLDKAHVDKFEAIGFERNKVVRWCMQQRIVVVGMLTFLIVRSTCCGG